MKSIFVYEHFSAGGAADALPDLLAEGTAMRDAIVADLCRLPGLQVACASGAADPALPAARRCAPLAGESEAERVRREAAAHDFAWIVAPESDGLLASLQAVVDPARWIGCDAAAIRTASSKSRTLAALGERGIRTPLGYARVVERWIVKPDDGAGAVQARVQVDRASAIDAVAAAAASGRPATIEPFVEGEPLSLSLLAGSGAARLLAINRQRIAIGGDGRLAFRGVDVAAIDIGTDARAPVLQRLADEVAAAIPGLGGFVGIDLVWHRHDGPVVIEVNPRATSAYVGLSAASGCNVAEAVIENHRRACAAHG